MIRLPSWDHLPLQDSKFIVFHWSSTVTSNIKANAYIHRYNIQKLYLIKLVASTKYLVFMRGVKRKENTFKYIQ